MRIRAALLGSLLLMGAVPSAAGAITNGEEDTGDRYPFVGMLAFYDGAGSYLHRCSGTLLSDTVVVTASHCTEGTSSARAYFEIEVTDDFRNAPAGGSVGTPITHPGYHPATLANDVAVVVLDGPAGVGGPFPVLPAVGMLGDLKRAHEIQDDSFVAVGYGGVPSFPPPIIEFDLVRRFASSPYQGLTRNNLHLNQNPNPSGAGGTCFGDSGGPRFWEDTLTIVAVTSWGDAVCRANDMTQRLDIKSAHDFVSPFLD